MISQKIFQEPFATTGPPIDEYATDPFPSQSSDVVVVGGGIVGVSTALFLAERGVSVTLCEKGVIGGEQSSRNWGWVRTMGRDPRELPLMLESMRVWEKLSAHPGLELGFQRSGIVYLCESERELSRRAAWLELAKPFPVEARVVDAAEIVRILPGTRRRWVGGLYTPTDARAEPQKAVPAIARHAREYGATIVTQCAVRGIETKAGRVAYVVTEFGTIACTAVVLAGGAWSRLFCQNVGVALPQLTVLASAMRVDGVSNAPLTAALGSGFAFRKRADGGYTVANSTASIADIVPDSFRLLRPFLPILRSEWKHTRLRLGRRFLEVARLPMRWDLGSTSPFETMRVLDPSPSHRQLDQGLRSLRAAFPQFASARVDRCWAGYIDVTPDAVPVISPAEAIPGLYVATGFSGHGFGIGPGAGRLTADLVMGNNAAVDPRPFRLSRFSDGTRLEVITGL